MNKFIYLIFGVLCACQSRQKLSEPASWYNPQWETETSQASYAQTWVGDPAGSAASVLRFEVRRGDVWSNHDVKTSRSEVSTNTYPKMNSTCSYGFDIYLPADFPIEDNRLVLAQWWAKTKKSLGESPRSPAVALRYRNRKLYVSVRHSDLRVVKNPESVTEEQIYQNSDFKLGSWHHFDFKIKWDFRQSGQVQVKHNGAMVADYKGPVGYNDDIAPQFRFGIYRDDSPKPYVLYYRDVVSSCWE